MTVKHKNILIISDIEGSSLCRNYEMSSFMTKSWPEACLGMSKDVSAVVNAFFNAGVESIIVKDFHRSGYNIFPEYVDDKAHLAQGYKTSPVPGIGNPGNATALVMIGMHAPSGSAGFLAHTLTSRIARLEVNGSLMSEAQLFSASVSTFGIQPVFFSGCPVACHHTLQNLEGIRCYPINKVANANSFNPDSWRRTMAREAVAALNYQTEPYCPKGPFHGVATMRDGKEVANQLGKRWKLEVTGSEIHLESDTIHSLYHTLMRICFLTPLVEKILPLGIQLFNARGKYGLWWARKKLINSHLQL